MRILVATTMTVPQLLQILQICCCLAAVCDSRAGGRRAKKTKTCKEIFSKARRAVPADPPAWDQASASWQLGGLQVWPRLTAIN